MKHAEEIMNILEAYDLTGSYRNASEHAAAQYRTLAESAAESIRA